MDPLEYNSNNYKQQVIDWAVRNPGALWQDTKEASAVRSWMEQNAPDDFASLYWNEDDTSKIDSRFIPMKARERRMEDAVRSRDKAVPYIAGALAAPVIAGEAISALPYMLPGTKFGNIIGDAAASMLGGETVDTIHRGLTGQPFGRGVANIFGATNLYDRSWLARFGFDAANPGYFMGGLATRGFNNVLDRFANLKRNWNIRKATSLYDNANWSWDTSLASTSELSPEQSAFKDALFGYRDKYLETHTKPQTVDEIKQFVSAMPDDQFSLLKKNFNKYINNLVKEDTYHKALTSEQIWHELPWMGRPESFPEIDRGLVEEYFRSDVLPRVLKNLRKSIPNFNQFEQQVIDLYNNPFNGVNMKMGYSSPGTGGYSLGENFIRYSNRHNAPDIETVVHELHHSLRTRLKSIIETNYHPSTTIETLDWIPAPKLHSGVPIRNQQALMEYAPNELEAMEPLAMTVKNSSDKTPVAEIGATLAGEQRFKMWRSMKDALGRSPTIEELNNAIQKMDYGQMAAQRNLLGYGDQIGSLLEESTDNFIKNVDRKYNLWQRISNDRYSKLPFYKRLFVKKPDIDFLEANRLTLDARIKSNQELLDAWKNALQTIGGFAGVGVVGNNLNNDPLNYNNDPLSYNIEN